MMINDELKHYGVKGMKWGVIRYANKKKAERYAKKIANAKAKENDIIAEFDKRLKTSKDPWYIHDSFMKVLDQQVKVKSLVDKFKSKYENTPLSDITVEDKIYNGRKYTQVLIGRVQDSPYDGTPRYEVTAGTWTKSNHWGADRTID